MGHYAGEMEYVREPEDYAWLDNGFSSFTPDSLYAPTVVCRECGSVVAEKLWKKHRERCDVRT